MMYIARGSIVLLLCLGACTIDSDNGVDGTAGADGLDGMDGLSGDNGQDGISCWDTNGNGLADPEEDINMDSEVNALDCNAFASCLQLATSIAEQRDTLDYFSAQITNAVTKIEALSGGLDIDNSGDINNPQEQNTQNLIQTFQLQLQNLISAFHSNAVLLQAMQSEYASCATPAPPPSGTFSCWDLNKNGQADTFEDINGDSNVDDADCLEPDRCGQLALAINEQNDILAYYDAEILLVSDEITALSANLDIDGSGDINLPQEQATQDLINTLQLQLQNLIAGHQNNATLLQSMQTAFASCAD